MRYTIVLAIVALLGCGGDITPTVDIDGTITAPKPQLTEKRILTFTVEFTQNDSVSTIEYWGIQGRDTVIAYTFRDNYVNRYECTASGAAQKLQGKIVEIAEDMEAPQGDTCIEASW